MKAFRFPARWDGGLLIALALTLFAVQALFKPGLPTAADLNIHMVRTVEYERIWAAGVLFPRWAPTLAYGYGYPLFIFAPPLPYMLAAAIQAVGLHLENTFKILIGAIMLLYAGGMYCFVRDSFHSRAAALVAATAYALAPFALREGLHYGGNVPQYLAIALFPWSLWSATRAVANPSPGWLILGGIFYAGIMLSHLFQVLIFTPVLGAFLVLLIGLQFLTNPTARTHWLRAASPLLIMPLGLLLSAFFWLPVIIERSYTRAESAAFLEKSPFFVRYPHWSELLTWIAPLDLRAANPYVPLSLGVITVTLATIGVVSLLYWGWIAVSRKQLAVSSQLSAVSHQQLAVSHQQDDSGEQLAVSGQLSAVSRQQVAVSEQQDATTSQKPILDDQLPATDYQLPATDDPLPATGYQLPANRYRLPANRYPLPFIIHTSSLIIFFTLLAATTIFMTLPVSRRVWEIVEPLQVAEFPWRMLGLANLSLAVLAGSALLVVPTALRGWVTALCLAVQLWAVAPLLYTAIPFVQRGDFSLADQIWYERSSQSIGTTTLGEYLPRTVDHPPESSPLVPDFEANRDPERLDRASLPPQAEATLLEQNAVTHRYRINSSAPFQLRLFHYIYPGWQADLDGQPLAITPEPETGLMLIDIPAGDHTLTVHFGDTPLRRIGSILTILTLLGGAIIITWQIIAQYRRPQPQTPSPSSLTPNDSSLIPNSQFLIPSSFLIILLIAIVLAAFALKPLLRPLFTVHSPPGTVIPAQQQDNIHFADGVRLTGYTISRQVVKAGDTMQVVLFWETDRGPYRINLQPFVHVDRLDTFTTVADATNYTPGDVTTEMNMPTFHWDNARYVRDEHDLWLSPDTPPQAYAVRVGLINADDDDRLVPLADGSGDTAWIGTINVAPTGRPPADLPQRLDTAFSAANGDTIGLLSAEVEPITADRLDFTLLWRSPSPPQVDYTVFAQLIDATGQLTASYDRPPLDGAYPTSTWLADQRIVDRRFIPLDNVPSGAYTLIVGLYDTATRQRMTTPAGIDHVEVATITVEE